MSSLTGIGVRETTNTKSLEHNTKKLIRMISLEPLTKHGKVTIRNSMRAV